MATKKAKLTKAESLMLQTQSTTERSSRYFERIKKSLYLSMIVSKEEAIEKIEDQILDLENMSLETNRNKGIKEFTKEEIEFRFKEILNKSTSIILLKMELKALKDEFIKYFGDINEISTSNEEV